MMTKQKITKRSVLFGLMAVVGGLFCATLVGVAAPQSVQAAACAVPNPNYGSATTTVNITTSSPYKIWSRIKAPNSTSNSYLLEIDGSTCFTVGDQAIAANSWTWVDYQNATTANKVGLQLSPGVHTIKMIGREPGLAIDRLIFANDQSCVPTGTGNNCLTSTTPPPAPSPPSPNPPSSGSVSVPYRMNVGGARYTDSNGTVWAADTYASGGQTNSQGAGKTIANAGKDSALYQDERWGMSGYSIPVADGTYTMALHFAELYPTCAGKNGCRVFSVSAEGKQVLKDFDISKTAGGGYAATVQLSTVMVTGGKLDIAFSKKVGEPALTGIQILPTNQSSSPPPSSGQPYNKKLLLAPDNRIFYVKDGQKSWIHNGALVGCISYRGAGSLVRNVPQSTINAYSNGDIDHCPYETEPGLNFVRERNSNYVWLVQAGGTKLHVGVACVPDAYTTTLKPFRIHVVPNGETAGHRNVGAFFGSPGLCGQLPK